MKLLLVEDNETLLRLLIQTCQEEGYHVTPQSNGNDAYDCALQDEFDLILLDVMLPGMNGIEVCRRWRASGLQTPILMITARDTLENKVEGLDAGADDYIIKPFQIAELLARLRALLRRRSNVQLELQVEDLVLDTAQRTALRGSKKVALSSTEYSLLEFLMRHPRQTLSRAEILDHVWQYDFGGQDNVLDVYISYLRQKLDRGFTTKIIHTVRGVGFRIGEEGHSP